MDEKIQRITRLIEKSDLDQTIKEILIRDLQTEGLSDFLREQIKAYCLEGLQKLDAQLELAKHDLESKEENPV
jgi:pimeloyl-CoA synthetase